MFKTFASMTLATMAYLISAHDLSLISWTFALLCGLALVFTFSKDRLSHIPMLALPSYPIVGQALSLPNDPTAILKRFNQAYHESGVIMNKKAVRVCFGPIRFVLLLHPDAAEPLLRSTAEINKSTLYRFLRPLVKDGLAVSMSDKWRRRRKMITPTFHHAILNDFLYVMNDHASTFVAYIAAYPNADIAKRLKLFALDVVCETAMGIKVDAQKDEDSKYVKAIHTVTECIGSRITNPLLANDIIFSWSSSGRRQREALKTIHSQSQQVIERKIKCSNEQSVGGGSRRKAFLDMLIDNRDENMNLESIQEEVQTFMFAGHDTSSLTLTWAIYKLGREKQVQMKLHEELDRVFGDNRSCDVTTEHLADLYYLDLVIKEVLRLYPAAPFVGRRLEHDMVIDGHTIPAGTDISISIYFLHRHPKVWTDPEKFIPERFSLDERSRRHPYAFVPFSAGPRNCIGQRFAIQQVKVLLAKFFRRFRVISHDAEDELHVNAGLVYEITQKLNLTFEERS